MKGAGNGGGTEFVGSPAREYDGCEVGLTRPMLPLTNVRVKAEASDQGSGGTDSCKVLCVLSGSDGGVKQQAQIAIVGHSMKGEDQLITRESCAWRSEVRRVGKESSLRWSPPRSRRERRVKLGPITVHADPNNKSVVDTVLPLLFS